MSRIEYPQQSEGQGLPKSACVVGVNGVPAGLWRTEGLRHKYHY